ncbi:hypothetical protein AVEN_222707-1 [Araneus ventricosus]|uniref:Uncharacterized protein n=1 Tax=Araneus ventricosus TaxID=182803 RepID=A0A4Y2B1K5_ARAVE|nr:hypothetical protein AVEN_222707-1 [Araneus ventricosus]
MGLETSAIIDQKPTPSLPKHPGKQLKDQPPQQIVGHCGSCIITPITTPRFTGVRPFFRSGPEEPHHHYCAIGLTRACLLIRQPLLRELTVSPRWASAIINVQRNFFGKPRLNNNSRFP